jgi:hypothetical protein
MRNEHTDKEIVDVLHHNFSSILSSLNSLIYNRIYDYLEPTDEELEYGDGEPEYQAVNVSNYIHQGISDKEIVDALQDGFPRIFEAICYYLDEKNKEVSHG